MTNNTSETIGCDLGDRKSELCVLDASGKITERRSVRTTRKAMTEAFTRSAAHVVIEVGAHSRWVAVLLQELGHRVTVANPRRVKAISAADTKTDRRDAELLARLGRADVDLLAPVQHRERQQQADLAVAKGRDILVATRTKLVNHVRGTMKCFGEQLPSCTAASFARQTRPLIPNELKAALDPVYAALERLDEQIKQCDQMIERVAKRYPDVEVVSQVNGVGVLTALVYILTIADKDRFKKSRMAGAFVGLRPRKSQSGKGDPELRITKAGDPFLRRLLVNGANYILGPFGQDCDLRRWGLELGKRGGKNAKKRAKVAVAPEERPQEVERPTAPSRRLRCVARATELEEEMTAPVWVGPQCAPGRQGGPSMSANGSMAERCFALLWTRPTRQSTCHRAASSWTQRSGRCGASAECDAVSTAVHLVHR